MQISCDLIDDQKVTSGKVLASAVNGQIVSVEVSRGGRPGAEWLENLAAVKAGTEYRATLDQWPARNGDGGGPTTWSGQGEGNQLSPRRDW